MNVGKSIFITGIDTHIGKSYATGYIANLFTAQNKKVITQKFIQTGNTGISEDIEVHRKIMNIPLLPEDKQTLTQPVVLSYPASPHLAARIDNTVIDLNKISAATAALEQAYDLVLIEGAGGIRVPINEDYTTLDYIKQQKLPVIIVTTPRLGSINHTLLTLDICRFNHIPVYAVAYNTYNIQDDIISDDTKQYLTNYLKMNYPDCLWIEIPAITLDLG
ncbi:ATP-dependent dethiobiotin synthetase BioD [Parabacteroides sp. 52]|uniref:dethiobiotin synthase n=1 Tax=unclassified Parabacteroides TaxID=2649774 RepID=UPI0013D4605A|nr:MULTISPECIES: dethiobiotin synthase [unclassified Parabacteroides]MDH6533999.1 dethiobiotin synthetase [Parabacteroides sp. PM5-20]NDV54740.1 ATP-dependent dethiobiotin synthetase BioD [Parabacteroides sp. 52]